MCFSSSYGSHSSFLFSNRKFSKFTFPRAPTSGENHFPTAMSSPVATPLGNTSPKLFSHGLYSVMSAPNCRNQFFHNPPPLSELAAVSFPNPCLLLPPSLYVTPMSSVKYMLLPLPTPVAVLGSMEKPLDTPLYATSAYSPHLSDSLNWFARPTPINGEPLSQPKLYTPPALTNSWAFHTLSSRYSPMTLCRSSMASPTNDTNPPLSWFTPGWLNGASHSALESIIPLSQHSLPLSATSRVNRLPTATSTPNDVPLPSASLSA